MVHIHTYHFIFASPLIWSSSIITVNIHIMGLA